MAEQQLLVTSVILQGLVTVIAGYALWRIREFDSKWSDAQDRQEKHNNLLYGNDEVDDDLMPGLIHLVEMHDKELERAAREREEAQEEREALRRKIESLLENCERRLGDSE